MQALVLSKLDYCNSLLIGTSEYNLNKLQRDPEYVMSRYK